MSRRNTEYLISHTYFSDNQESDMTAKEMQYIKLRNEKKLGHLDLADVMYDCYRLGYAKALLANDLELPKKK